MEKKRIYVSILFIFFLLGGIGSFLNNQTVFGNQNLIQNTNTPIDQDYSTNSTSNFSNGNVTASIQQSYVDTSVNNYDQDTANFSIPAPTTSNYNTSFTNVSVSNLKVENYTMTLQNATETGSTAISANNPEVTSFTVSSNCYLTNFSFYLVNLGSTASVDLYLYNSIWNSGQNQNYPNSSVSNPDQIFGPMSVTAGSNWYSLTGINYYLDNANTANNTWYIGLIPVGVGVNVNWWYCLDDNSAGGAYLNETSSYYYAGTAWALQTDGSGNNVDFCTMVGLSLNETSVNPSDINLNINGTSVSDNVVQDYGGFWSSSSQLNGGLGFINFTFKSDWYLYSFDVDNVLINYTKYDFPIITNFTVQSDSEVYWNASTSITAFDSQFTNNSINITIPSAWNPLSLHNSTTDSVIWNSYIPTSTSKILIISGENATNDDWFLICNSTNLLQSINTSVGGIKSSVVYSNESLGISTNFSTPVSGVVNLSVYNPASSVNNSIVYTENKTITNSNSTNFDIWDVSQNITEYGDFRIQVTWNNQTDAAIMEKNITILAVTNMVFTPISGIEKNDTDTNPFNITLTYTDLLKNTNVTGAMIGYNLNNPNLPNGTKWQNSTEYNPDGTYNITIIPNNFTAGQYNIPITINKTYYQNYTFNFVLNIVGIMHINQITQNNLYVIRGQNTTYSFSYENSTNNPISGAEINAVLVNSNFIWSPSFLSGVYSITLNTSQIDVGTYNCMFNITEISYQTLNFSFNVIVTQAQTQLTINSGNNSIIPRYTGDSETVQFSVTDISNVKAITGIPSSALTVYNGSNNASVWNPGWTMWGVGNGVYYVNISLAGLDMGNYSVLLNISYAPNYYSCVNSSSFYVQGNMTTINLEGISNGGNVLLFNETNGYGVYQHTKRLGLNFTVNDLDSQNQTLTNKDAFKYWVYLDNTTLLPYQFSFDANHNWNTGTVSLDENINPGNYTITLITGMKNYENASKIINLRIIPEYNITIQMISQPQNLVQGQPVHLTFKITYINGTMNLANAEIVLSTNNTEIGNLTGITNATGFVTFDLTPPTGDYSGLTLTLTYNGIAYGINSGTNSFSISILPAPGVPMWVIYLILGAAVVIAGAVGIQRGVIAPRKRRYRELLLNTSAVFEDAINLQHILIIYKDTGTCVFFKSFGMETIDPDLIAGFLSAAQSFAKESMSADGLSEIVSKGSHLLISDGQSVRVTLVLSKPASQFLRQNISRFVMLFESQYSKPLTNWKGSLNAFKDSGKLVDEILHTSIILPHEITSDIKTLKSISSVMARNLLKIARGFTSEKRNFFFIAQLVAEAKEKMKKKPPEILIGLNELLEKKVISPVDLSKFEAQPISQQEMNLLQSRVSKLPNLTEEEKQTIVQDLAGMNAPEREATLTSLQQGRKITSDVSKRMVTTKVFTSQKEAKFEINKLLKVAQKSIKQKKFSQAIQCYETAEVTAAQWKMPDYAKRYRDKALDTQISSFNYTIKNAKSKVSKLRKLGKTQDALNLAHDAYDAASSMFKLGFTDYDKDVKYFNKLLNDIRTENGEKDSGVSSVSKESKDTLYKSEKELLKEVNKAEKNKDLRAEIAAYSKLSIVADKLFKFGVVAATSDIKKYRAKIGEIKEQINNEIEVGSSDIPKDEELQDQKSKLLNIAEEAENAEDYLKALVAYQEIINIYHILGEPDNALRSMGKTNSIVAKIPNITDVLDQLMDSAEKHTDEQSYQNAFAEYQYAKGICEAIGDVNTSNTIKKKLEDLSKHL